jgi:hypothetical protein
MMPGSRNTVSAGARTTVSTATEACAKKPTQSLARRRQGDALLPECESKAAERVHTEYQDTETRIFSEVEIWRQIRVARG